MDTKKILIVEDDLVVCDILKNILIGKDRAITTTATLSEARQFLQSAEYDLAFFDLYLPDGSGIQLLSEFGEKCSAGVIIMTAFGCWEAHVLACRLGAYYFLDKPFRASQVRSLVEQALRESVFRNHPG